MNVGLRIFPIPTTRRGAIVKKLYVRVVFRSKPKIVYFEWLRIEICDECLSIDSQRQCIIWCDVKKNRIFKFRS